MYNKWTVHKYKCLFLTFVFLQIERERERGWYIKLGIKEKWPQSYLSYFLTGFHWRIFLLSRANSLHSIFFYTGLKNLGSLVSQIFFCLQPGVNGHGFVCHEPCSKTNFLTIYFRWRGGGRRSPTSVLGSQPIIWLLSPSPSGVRLPEVTKYQHLLISPLWPTFSLNGHFFDGFPLFIPTGG